MAFIIAEPCLGTCDTSCVEVCPVDCILGPHSLEEIQEVKDAGDQAKLDTMMLYIHPDICIDCGACEPECPVEAIFEEDDTPEEWISYIKINADYFED
jgi:NAD-dependent dihydropyrimidine dehydrogenase PreA subunit